MLDNQELEIAEKFVKYTNRNIFLTGKAGTGKTTFLKSLKLNSPKRMVVVAPTGVAAINAGGVTIHSFFQLPFGPILTEKVVGHKIESQLSKLKFNRKKINIIKTLDLLVIDEISMVRADILDAIDDILRRYKNRFKPFGGVQLLMIGDLQQLAPVVKSDEMYILKDYYPSLYFFNSHALQLANMVTVELKYIYRQQDDVFVKILNEIRDDEVTKESYNLLHERYIEDFKPAEKGYITLTTHNRSADIINEEKLSEIKEKKHTFTAIVEGVFSEYAYPAEFELVLKVGAQVMFIKNDSSPEKRYFNGKIGEIVDFGDDFIEVKSQDSSEIIYTAKEMWENIRYNINPDTKEIEEDVIGTFTQYPLRLAWAITIHKSQGLTFEKAVIDAADAFAHGQTYVALSRCKTLEGLVLSSKISQSAIICDKEIRDFNKTAEENQPDENILQESVQGFQLEILNELFNYNQILYRVDELEKKLREYSGNFSGNIGIGILEIKKDILPPKVKDATNFLKQVNRLLAENPDAEKNTVLQDRLKAAANFFIKFHQDEIIVKLENSSFESDNRIVQKEVKESLNQLTELLNIKQQCLNVCLNGFNVKDYLDVRAKTSLEENKTKFKVDVKDVETEHSELYSRLKTWRRDVADDIGKQAYLVVSNKALQEISNTLPATEQQLLGITGIGKTKFVQYGKDILNIVNEYLKENEIASKEDKPEEPKKSKKKNWERSYEMFKAGKTVEEIAQEQGFVISTIESHLGRYVATGNIAVEELVDKNILKTIMEYFDKNPLSTLVSAKEELSDKITYGQIKLVLKHREFVAKQGSLF